ncbi:protein FAM3B-like [Acipenser ruthenus]|uniref:protein FAM3B-like n=1 Tax=Acipenser ruthenus TaxID=7906 RepID=UPI0015600526|nr:protein FAM3B-like [Acipenser ruthenus]
MKSSGGVRGDFFKFLALIVGCGLAWYLGQICAVLLPPETFSVAVSQILEKPSINAPLPKRQKCDHSSPCPIGSFAFRVLSGGGKNSVPTICFEEVIMKEGKGNTREGINIAAVDAATGKVHGSDSFNMWEGDNARPLIQFINGIPNNSIVLMATYDDGSTKLSQEARKEIEKLGSKEIQQIGFRSSWVFVGAKGFTLPKGLKKEKMNHSNKEKNRYNGWPAEVQIEGCIPRRQ